MKVLQPPALHTPAACGVAECFRNSLPKQRELSSIDSVVLTQRGEPMAVSLMPGLISSGLKPPRTAMLAGAPSTKLMVSVAPSLRVRVSVIEMCGFLKLRVATTPSKGNLLPEIVNGK